MTDLDQRGLWVAEVETSEGTRFVHERTPRQVYARADELYGKGQWKLVKLTTAKEALCLK